MNLISPRRRLYHTPPFKARNDSRFFLTVCCAKRNLSQLDKPAVFRVMSAAIEHYMASEKWWMEIFLAMPDHWHALVGFREVSQMEGTVRDWKRFVAKQADVIWQDGFFDHRLRTNESAQEKWQYICLNPVRKGLVAEPEEWKYVWTPENMMAR